MLESRPKRAWRMIILVRWLVANVSVIAFPLVVKSHPCLTGTSHQKWKREWQSPDHWDSPLQKAFEIQGAHLR